MAEPAPRMHPRMRTRRVEVRREAGRRRLRLVVATAVTLGLVAGGWGLTRSPLLDVDDIRIVGADRSDPGALLDLAGLDHGRAMLDIDARTAAAAMGAAPWVDTAEVVRDWPGTVVVRVTERVPVAAVIVGDHAVLADATGRALALVPPAEVGGGVVVVSVPEDTVLPEPGTTLAGPVGEAVGVAAAAVDAVADRDLSLRIDADRGLVLGVGNGVDAVLGDAGELPAKLTALGTMLARVELRRGSTIDLRVPSAPVLTRG